MHHSSYHGHANYSEKSLCIAPTSDAQVSEKKHDPNIKHKDGNMYTQQVDGKIVQHTLFPRGMGWNMKPAWNNQGWLCLVLIIQIVDVPHIDTWSHECGGIGSFKQKTIASPRNPAQVSFKKLGSYISIHTLYIYTYRMYHDYVYMYIHIYIYICECINIYIYVYVYADIACVHVYKYVCIYNYIYIWLSVYVPISLW